MVTEVKTKITIQGHNVLEYWYNRNKTSIAWRLYHQKRREAKAFEENYKYSILVTERNKNPRQWWSLIKRLYKDDNNFESIPPLEIGDTLITNDKEKAQEFNDFFLKASVLDEQGASLPPLGNILEGPKLCDIPIQMQDVIDQIKCLDIAKSYGPDGLYPY